VFEWVSSDLGSQSTVCGGGRYDPLVAELSGKENYAIGFAIGLERLLLSLEAQNKLIIKPDCDIYIVNDGVGAAEMAFNLAQELRTLGYKVIQHLGGGSFRSQFKKADSSGARLSLVIGENEVKLNQVVLKLMAEQKQELIAHTQLSQYVTNFFNS
jgi:histidyl-tRNA synthetase